MLLEIIDSLLESKLLRESIAVFVYSMEGPNTGLGWQIEGARTVPLPPRPPPLTKYKLIADKAVEMALKLNAQRLNNPAVLPHPTLRRGLLILFH